MTFDNTRIDELMLFFLMEEEQALKPVLAMEKIEAHASATEEYMIADQQELLVLLHTKLDSNYLLSLEEINRMLKLERA